MYIDWSYMLTKILNKISAMRLSLRDYVYIVLLIIALYCLQINNKVVLECKKALSQQYAVMYYLVHDDAKLAELRSQVDDTD